MILVDANLLIYAHVGQLSLHERARQWLDSSLNGRSPVGLPWPSILAFMRITTNPRIFEWPKTAADAWKQVKDWLACPTAWIPLPSDQHAEIFGELVNAGNITANLVPDAHLAALAIEHGLELCSTDADFAKFTGLRWQNPIA